VPLTVRQIGSLASESGVIHPPALQDNERRRVVEEVLELGETLFDAVIGEASLESRNSGETAEDFPLDEAHAASEAFFDALRLLFGLSVNSTQMPRGAMCGDRSEAQD
jgi:hypothetical protein